MIQSVFAPLVDSSQGIGGGDEAPLDRPDRLLTIPTLTMTAPRPVIAGRAAYKIINGIRGASLDVALCLATDMEGAPARWIDIYFPESGLGTSTFGRTADIAADTAALLEIGVAAMIGPRIPLIGKGAVGIVFGHEGVKSAWALNANRLYRNAGSEEQLYIPPTNAGKCSMAEKMAAVGLAVLASEFNHQIPRQTLASAAMAFALIGTARGEEERKKYAEKAHDMIESAMKQAKKAGFIEL